MNASEQTYTMEDYGRQGVFAGFLPGIAGLHGIPVWCYYVNRGQCIASFGVENKDRALMEFLPAHLAYRQAEITGFRTFVRLGGAYLECFTDAEGKKDMEIGMNSLTISQKLEKRGLEIRAEYYTLPEEKVGALVRRVYLKNLTNESMAVELLDGIPEVVPYGVDDDSLKKMTQTAQAWMQAEDAETGVPYFRVRASLADSASVQEVVGGNFGLAYTAEGEKLLPIVDPGIVFGWDTSLQKAVGFERENLTNLYGKKQHTQNMVPCCFFGREKHLQPGETLEIYELFGQAENKSTLHAFAAQQHDAAYFDKKSRQAAQLTWNLTEACAVKTGDPDFDAYCRYNYMDNVLRGGMPMKLGNSKVFYAYSRKHGDLERDYNYFSMLPEFYSQGNGNYRDVCQNRRSDVFFSPFVGTENIKAFGSLIQLDGYNPLGVEKTVYSLREDRARMLLSDPALIAFVVRPFTPGALYRKLEELYGRADEKAFLQIIDFADAQVNGAFLEGYWSDHWTYDLDLIEDYLEIYPDRERELLYTENLTWFESQANIRHRQDRYVETEKGLRQYRALQEETRRDTADKLVKEDFGKGGILQASLAEKLLLLCALKFSALDAWGMGVEMEGGKPGWYDALNGLPGLFGSSMAETYELERLICWCMDALQRFPGEVSMLEEISGLLDELDLICRLEQDAAAAEGEVLSFWNRINDVKESYRDRTYEGVSGKKVSRKTGELADILTRMEHFVRHGIEKACRQNGGLCPTYFSYEVTDYEKQGSGFMPKHFEPNALPLFLEGPVRYLKLGQGREEKQTLWQQVRESDLFDRKLQMYKVCASLSESSYELGRARAFTPGWLENESIWLHMEYKYMLELLRSGLYEEFFEDLKKCAVPFLDPKVYGRSIYENSSFIASSANPNERTHGRGYVARLSGSTAEFISMWKAMFFGKNLFCMKGGELTFMPQPALPACLIPADGRIETQLFGTTRVILQFDGQRDYIPGQYEIRSMRIELEGGSAAQIRGGSVSGTVAEQIRSGRARLIHVEINGCR